MRLIDADALVDVLIKSHNYHANTGREAALLARDTQIVFDAPTIDAVPVVRCKDCKHCIWFEEYAGSYYPFCTTYAGHIGENDFCSYGERKDGEG